jgi:hypothetical protein
MFSVFWKPQSGQVSLLFSTMFPADGAVFLFCHNCQPDQAANAMPSAMNKPFHYSNPAVRDDSPAAPPNARASHSSQQQLVASTSAAALPMMVVEFFIV